MIGGLFFFFKAFRIPATFKTRFSHITFHVYEIQCIINFTVLINGNISLYGDSCHHAIEDKPHESPHHYKLTLQYGGYIALKQKYWNIIGIYYYYYYYY